VLFVLAGLFRRRRSALDVASATDEELLTAYVDGDVDAFEALMRRHERRVLHFIYRSVHDAERAQDLAQEVWLRVVKNAARYQATAKFTTWLFTIARNVCIDASRRDAKRRTQSLDAPIGDDDASATFGDRVHDPRAVGAGTKLDRDAFRAVLHDALAKLPDEQRDVFLLRHEAGMRFVEIAAMCGLSENTVKSRMRYALQQLRPLMSAFEGQSFDDDERDEVGHDRDA